ncbi:MAG: hypothetical protein ABSH50_07515 [Bryobacteraceae bacterium]|jgi:VCBS repeat-containing protein
MALATNLVCASALANAETYTGQLMDANCAAQQARAACAPTDATTVFALQVSGKTWKLDADGNQKAADALKAGNGSADRAKDPSASLAVTARVEGTVSGDQIKVDSIQIQ